MTQPSQMMVITLAVLATIFCPVDGEKGEWTYDPRTGKKYIELNETEWYHGICSQVGGFEPEPKDEEENSFLAGLGTESFRLGINDAVKDGCWRYNRDDSEVSYFNWGHITGLTPDDPEPNGGIDAACVIMMGTSWAPDKGGDPKEWMDVKCNQVFYFDGLVCEKDCPDDRFGMNCTKDCHCSGVCHEVSGVCLSYCLPGWRGNDCQQECQDGKFGINCTNVCQCENRVTVNCHHINGSCLSDCLPAWTGDDCQEPKSTPAGNTNKVIPKECPEGKFAMYCTNDCQCENRVTRKCGRYTGVCLSACLQGWSGRDCETQDCHNGTYGPNCANDCQCENRVTQKCDHRDGSCSSGCLEGWIESNGDCQKIVIPQSENDKSLALTVGLALTGVAAVLLSSVGVAWMVGNLYSSASSGQGKDAGKMDMNEDKNLRATMSKEAPSSSSSESKSSTTVDIDPSQQSKPVSRDVSNRVSVVPSDITA